MPSTALATVALLGAVSTVWLNATRSGFAGITNRQRYRRAIAALSVAAFLAEVVAGVLLLAGNAAAAVMLLAAAAANLVVLEQCRRAAQASRITTT